MMNGLKLVGISHFVMTDHKELFIISKIRKITEVFLIALKEDLILRIEIKVLTIGFNFKMIE